LDTRAKIEPDVALMIDELRTGDSEAWAEFIRRYRTLIYAAIHRTNARFAAGWDETVLEEMFEEALFKLLRDRAKALASWKGRCKLETWIYRIVRNVCIDYLRRESRRSGNSDLVEESVDSAAGDRSSADLRLSLEQAMDSVLTPRESIAVRLIYFEGFTYREVGERLGMTVGAVSGLVYRALARLRRDGGLGSSEH
jgi:RNA polymerase sigma-70 factor (ECF subfamily)